MPSAKKDEVTIVAVEGEGYNGCKVNVPFVAMKAGTDFQTYVDVLIPGSARLRILQGKGPIHLVGCHSVEEITTEADEDAADEEESEDLSEKEDTEANGDVKIKDVGTEDGAKGGSDTVSPAKGDKKRKASADLPKSGEKKSNVSPAK